MTIFGSDVSHYDGADTRAMFDQGIAFQTHKAGGDADDAELATWWRLAAPYRTRGVLLGAYWVLYPGSPATRANRFIARLDSQCPGWRDGPFILQADCEKWNGDANTVPSIAEINDFCDQLVAKMPKLNPIAYAPEWVYGTKLRGLNYPIWASHYVTGSGGYRALYPGDSSSRWVSGGREATILQYSSSATIGGKTTSDANAFRGTLDQLTDRLAPGWKKEIDMSLELTDKYGDRGWPNRTLVDHVRDEASLRDVWWGDDKGTAAAPALPADSPLAQLIAVPDRLTALETAVQALASAPAPTVTQEMLNEAVYAALKQLAAGAV